jgi:hypothetical protein
MDGKSIEKTALILNESNGLTEKFLNALRPDESIDEDQMQLVARLLLEMRHEIAADALGEVENVEVIIKLVMGAGDEKILDMALLIYDHEELRSKVIEALMSNKNSVADQEIREQMARKIPEEVHYIEKITNELQEEGKDDEAIIACINKVALRSTTMAGLILNDNADIARKVLITLCPDENGNGDQLQLAVSLLLAMKYDRAAEALGGIKDCKVIARLIANMGVENTKKIALILSKDMNLAEKVLTALRSAADGAYGEKSLEQMADAIDHEINCIYVSIYEKECDNEIIEFIMKTALNNMNRIVSILEVDVEFAEESLKLLRSSGKNKKQKVATAISQKMKNREKLLKDIALVECGDIVQGVMPMENVSVNSSKSADLPTERGKSNDEIQPKINSVPFIGNDKKIQLEMGKSKDLTSAEAKKSPLYGVWLRVITATVGCGALAGIAIIIALEIVAAVIPLMATLVALVLASIAIECASFALEKGEHNPSDAAK